MTFWIFSWVMLGVSIFMCVITGKDRMLFIPAPFFIVFLMLSAARYL